ncbi:MAG: ankyrin repeat domain-containing protein [Nitrospira sp.]|nr:ankyrin repeat domain-containing protein [Nitrospira sp.]
MTDQRTLDDLLQGIADVLFPAEETPPCVALDSAGYDGDSPLHVYLWRKDPYAVKTLIQHGANVNAIGDMGETPLHVAVREASADILASLLAAGAREDIVSEFGQTPLQLAQLKERGAVYREAKAIARDLKRIQLLIRSLNSA